MQDLEGMRMFVKNMEWKYNIAIPEQVQLIGYDDIDVQLVVRETTKKNN